MKDTGFVYSPRFLDHRTPSGHPEQPGRLSFLIDHLHSAGLWDALHHIMPKPAGRTEILRVHTSDHLGYVHSVCARGGGMLDEGDTHASKDSYDVALLAAGAVCTAIDAVLDGTTKSAFCAVRPPGHHAERDRPMGFCLFNNIAIGALHARQSRGISRVAILDWDVHHGNGTQHAFEDDPSVFFISLHQYPFYPGTGAREETGIGEGKGYTLNFPMPEGAGDERYLAAFREEIVPALKEFKPGLLLISAGFDAHKDDPLAGIRLTESSYAELTSLIIGIAPVVSVMEGGYNLQATAGSVEAHLVALGEG